MAGNQYRKCCDYHKYKIKTKKKGKHCTDKAQGKQMRHPFTSDYAFYFRFDFFWCGVRIFIDIINKPRENEMNSSFSLTMCIA